MSSITSTSNTAAANAAANATAAAAASTPILGQNDFLTLLMAQMQNQDPLNPTDDTAFVTQLAQFSSVEQLTNMNSTMTELLTAQAGANQTATVSLVGKSVQVNNNTVTVGTSGAPVQLAGTLSGSAAKVTATIVNSAGQTVDTVQFGASAQGSWTGTWNGRDSNGNAVPAGSYTVNLSAVDASGNALTASSTSTGIVTGVSFVNGAAQLIVNGQTVPLSSVTEIDQAPATTSNP